MNKRGLSDVITTLIIVLLSLVAIGIVWVVISNIIKSGEQQTSFQFGTLFLDLQLEKVVINTNGDVAVTVERGVGEGDLAGVAFVFSDGTKSVTVKKDAVISELGSQVFTFTPAELQELAFVKQVEIAPILDSNGKEQIGRAVDMEKSDYFSSCKTIMDSGNAKGDGTYTIDTDGLGSAYSFQVYCDMTTDGGGWTLTARTIPGASGNIGWKVHSGSINNQNAYYSLGSPFINNFKFTELLLGKEKPGEVYKPDRNTSNNLVKISGIPNNFLSVYNASALAVTANISDLNNGPTSYGTSPSRFWNLMVRYIGHTDNTNVYFFRDTSGVTSYGLRASTFNTCYNTGNFCNGNTACSCSSSTDRFLLFVR